MGDCVKHLTRWNAENQDRLKSARSLADLIYLDPPWNSNANYNILWDKGDNADHGHTAQATAFTNIWHWTDEAAERVQMLCNSDFHPHGPQSPLLRVRRVMPGLRTVPAGVDAGGAAGSPFQSGNGVPAVLASLSA